MAKDDLRFRIKVATEGLSNSFEQLGFVLTKMIVITEFKKRNMN